MHPNPLFRSKDEALLAQLVKEIGLATLFLATPDGPRVAHAPLVAAGERRWRFHLARSNALTPHLHGAQVLAVATGPQGYISPRWYAERGTIPTWDYVAIELEGMARRLDEAELDALLYEMIEQEEARLGGDRWLAHETPAELWQKLMGAIVGFELVVDAIRPTIKLSQKRSAAERETIASGVAAAGNSQLAAAMRALVQ